MSSSSRPQYGGHPPFLTLDVFNAPSFTVSPPSAVSPLSPQTTSNSNNPFRQHLRPQSGEISPLDTTPHNEGSSPDSEVHGHDISRISGFPAVMSGFDFGFDADSEQQPPSPSGERQPSNASQLQLIPNTAPAAALPYHARSSSLEDVEAPPPYTRYDERDPPPVMRASSQYWMDIASAAQRPLDPRPRQLSYPAPAHTTSHRGRRSGRFASTSDLISGIRPAPARQQSQRKLHTMTLQDLRNRSRSTAELERQRLERRQQRRNMWRGRWFCLPGGCCGFGHGPTGMGEKRRARRWWCVFGIVLGVILLAMLIGGLALGLKKKSPSEATTIGVGNATSDEVDGFPLLPTGTVVFTPQASPSTLTTCVGKPQYWSCTLPPDTQFPITNATTDGVRVPKFSFVINRNSSSRLLAKPFPTIVPNDTDYRSVASVDEIKSASDPEGEESNYTISLITSTSDGDTSSDQSPANMLPDGLINQPLRLFDRGLDSEHYGFHTYFKKTIYVDNTTDTDSARDVGGVAAAGAGMQLSWDFTRFVVQIFTNKNNNTDISRRSGNSGDIELPVAVWEDRAGGFPAAGRTLNGWTLREDGTVDKKVTVPEVNGVLAGVRGCYCEWSNFDS